MKIALASILCYALYWASVTGSPARSGPEELSAVQGPEEDSAVPCIRYDERQLYLLNNPEELKAGTTDLTLRWPDATVYYTMDSTIDAEQKKKILEGWQMIADTTCVTFVERTTEENYIDVFNKGSGWWSRLGMRGGRQDMNMGPRLRVGTAAHEMMHALGIQHEQSRFDRDDWVRIDWQALATFDNANTNWTAQYVKQPQSEADVYGVPFSYESIMLYDKTSPKGGDPQIMYALVPGMDDVMGQRSHLADTDIQLINAMYKCQ